MNKKGGDGILQKAATLFREIVEQNNLLDVDVTVLVKPLTPEEAIGVPGRRDFPIIIGKERIIEAEFQGAKGHAYTDSPQDFVGVLRNVLGLELNTNHNRAIYIATLNAVLGSLGQVDRTVHCKDEEPEECALEIAGFLLGRYGKKDVGLIGLNPAIAERLINAFGADHVHITDLSRDNIGKQKFGVEVWDGSTRTEELVEVSDIIVFTGTTLVNDTFTHIWNLIQSHKRNYLVYGVTAAGVCQLLGIERICPCGRDGACSA